MSIAEDTRLKFIQRRHDRWQKGRWMGLAVLVVCIALQASFLMNLFMEIPGTTPEQSQFHSASLKTALAQGFLLGSFIAAFLVTWHLQNEIRTLIGIARGKEGER